MQLNLRAPAAAMSIALGSGSAPLARGSLRAWLMAARPATLTAALSPVIVGSACALHGSNFRVGAALGAMLGATLLQIGANFANDVFDFEKGADTAERLGPTRAVQAGLVTPREMRIGMAVVFGLALMCGAYLTAVAGPWIVVIGLLSIACAVAYTGGPYPLGYHGLGDVFVFIFFGPVAVVGSAFVHARELSGLALAASIPVGALTTAILVVNNLRDHATDLRAGKRTLAVRFGLRFTLIEYFALLVFAYLVPVVLCFWPERFALQPASAGNARLWLLLPLFSLPVAALTFRAVRASSGRALNPLLGKTARLLFFFSALFAAGLVLSLSPSP
ncbi:MAG TPA: 1,4-dihydroxy-2-naphthoate polyprenyltransferase [Polyangiaceae bacterium]|nr:1,4-dihydroxy-2-naphthoate polyprenyltransferase [Polyangiaceae bacterium]